MILHKGLFAENILASERAYKFSFATTLQPFLKKQEKIAWKKQI